MRLAIAAASAILITALAVPAVATHVATDVSAATELSAAKKKKKKVQAPKEEYLRAAPMAPPEGQKKK
jgi:hypothetical protein